MKRKLPLLLLIVIAAALAAWFWHASLDKPDAKHLTLHGNVDIREVNLGFRVTGRINEVLKDEGTTVVAGEIIARLDSAPITQEVFQAQAALAAAQADLQRLSTGYRPEEIAQARAQVSQFSATFDNSRLNAERAKQLVAQNAAAQQTYDDARTAAVATEKQLDSAKASLALIEAGYRTEDIAKARALAAQYSAALETARIRLSDTNLTSPSAGTILTRALEAGSIAQAGATVFTLSLDNPVWIRAYVNEPDLGKIAPGMKVEILTDSRPGKPYEGVIGYISPRAEFTPKTIQTESLRTTLVYRLRITVTNTDNMLRQGMPVTIRLPLATVSK